MKDDILAKNIIDLLGLSSLPEEKKAQLLEQMTAIVQSRIARRIDSQLNEVQKKEFDRLLETQSDQAKIDDYLRGVITNFDKLATEEIISFKEEMVREAQSVRTALKP